MILGTGQNFHLFHLFCQVETDGGKSLDLSNYPYIFMRWKEQYFVNVCTDCGLAIAGFYYVCFYCSDGSINGFYYDPNSSKMAHKTGYASFHYEVVVIRCNVIKKQPLCAINTKPFSEA